jgi:hypothetical protein
MIHILHKQKSLLKIQFAQSIECILAREGQIISKFEAV